MVRISDEHSPQTAATTTNGTPNFSKKSNVIDKIETTGDEAKEKKTSMKTADDVISRIQWDERLKKIYFRVGYIDRFLGLQEKPFTDFDFEIDLASVNDRCSTILAIPKHRIQYFKYQNEIIWDKETRTDNVFGSTGSQLTIYDIIQRLPPVTDNNDVTTNEDNERSVKPEMGEGTKFVPRCL
ncbi:unnamed protein product [Didymodactylos carnosus]|nr:unnamed protein product [Didymodactylos carnosus]CAF4369919.1 unnamed protein product [Didymodactylos carnosus]